MTDTDTIQALERIERALARIEVLEQPVAPPPPPADAALVERHDRLRARVAQTIERLDAMIAGGGA